MSAGAWSRLLGQQADEFADGGLDHDQAAGAELPVAGEVSEVVLQVADLVRGILQVALAERLSDAAELILQVGGGGRLDGAAVFGLDDGQPQGVHRACRGNRRVMTDAPAPGRLGPAYRSGPRWARRWRRPRPARWRRRSG